jgi:hypothetical protein
MAARREGGGDGATAALSDLVMNVELTLVSVIQATIMFFLIEGAHEPLVSLSFAAWPYVATAFVITLLFWARALLHTLTVIRWPLDYLHNFVYLGCTVFQSLMAAELAKPLRWYALGAAYFAVAWILFVVDRRMIARRAKESRAAASRELFQLLDRDQALNIKLLVPCTLGLSACGAVAVWQWPEVFVEQKLHLALVAGQLAGALGYLIYSMRFFAKVAPHMVRSLDAESSDAPDEAERPQRGQDQHQY